MPEQSTQPHTEMINGQEWLMTQCNLGHWHPWRKVIRITKADAEHWEVAREQSHRGWFTDNAGPLIGSAFMVLFVLNMFYVSSHPLPESGSQLNAPTAFIISLIFLAVEGLIGILPLCLIGAGIDTYVRHKRGYKEQYRTIREEILTRHGLAHIQPNEVGLYDQRGWGGNERYLAFAADTPD